MSSFHVGQKVVCIDASEKVEWHPKTRIVGDLDGLTEGKIYTIREVYIDMLWGVPLVMLVEIIRPFSFYEGEYFESGFDPSRFRRVVERKTDISQFKAMLSYQPKVVVLS